MTAATDPRDAGVAGSARVPRRRRGRPLLLLHGLGGSAGNWVEVVARARPAPPRDRARSAGPRAARRPRAGRDDGRLRRRRGRGARRRGRRPCARRRPLFRRSRRAAARADAARSRPRSAARRAGRDRDHRTGGGGARRRHRGDPARARPSPASGIAAPIASGTGGRSSGPGSSPIRSRCPPAPPTGCSPRRRGTRTRRSRAGR